MALPGRVRDFLHDHSVEGGILAAVGIGLGEALAALAALESIEGARIFFSTTPLWLWAIPPTIVGFLVWLRLHDLPPSSEVQKVIDNDHRASAQFAKAERTRRASKR
jgi:hypothetical protein